MSDHHYTSARFVYTYLSCETMEWNFLYFQMSKQKHGTGHEFVDFVDWNTDKQTPPGVCLLVNALSENIGRKTFGDKQEGGPNYLHVSQLAREKMSDFKIYQLEIQFAFPKSHKNILEFVKSRVNMFCSLPVKHSKTCINNLVHHELFLHCFKL